MISEMMRDLGEQVERLALERDEARERERALLAELREVRVELVERARTIEAMRDGTERASLAGIRLREELDDTQAEVVRLREDVRRLTAVLANRGIR